MALGGALALAACDWGSEPSPVPAAVEVVGGAAQTATVFQPIPIPPAVRVVSAKGKPVRGLEVVFSVAPGGGSVSGNVAVTDKNGVARVGTWILGTAAGEQSLQVRVGDLPLLTIPVFAVAAAPAKMASRAGDSQSGVVGMALEIPPQVRVTDVYGNPVEGAQVEIAVVEGGGHVLNANPSTNSEGIASTGAWTLGRTPGVNRLTASVQGLASVTFRATAAPDVPHQAAILLGDGQTAEVASPLAFRPTLLIVDRFGNLLEGIPVKFQVLSGGGSISHAEQLSDAAGVVVAGVWTLGPTAGLQTLGVSVPHLDPIVLSATAEPGPPAMILADAGQNQTTTVGQPVAVPPMARVEDAFGNPVPDVDVAFSITVAPGEGESPGTLLGPKPVTDEEGLASPTGWTLGTRVGTYGVEARVAGVVDGAVFLATALADVPGTVTEAGGNGQSGLAGSPLPIPLSVRVEDRFGNPTPDVSVEFRVLEGGGALSAGGVLTDAEGLATMAGWTLGPVPGLNRAAAMVDGVGSVEFEATGLAATPAYLAKVAGDGQTATVGTPVTLAPRVEVRDAQGNPVPDVPVAFQVLSGGGAVGIAEAATDPKGQASAGSWLLGPMAGTNLLSASFGDLPPVTFSATGLPGPAVTLEVARGPEQKALVGTYVPIPPAVRVRDEYGNPIPGMNVTFSVVSGGGWVSGGMSLSNGEGVASVGRWTLGPMAGINTLSATAVGLDDITFGATAFLPGGFSIELEYLTPVAPSQAAVFDDAGARWEGIVVGDVSDFHDILPAGGCQPVTVDGEIDDVRIYVAVRPIDGTGGILGRAGPCYFRRSSSGVSPITGIMEFDEADLAGLEVSGLLEDVIVHEMGHVLGFGSLWSFTVDQILVGRGTADPYFQGPAAIHAFDESGGEARTGTKVPVENTGGPGTQDSHWRESVHNAELMTGWIEGGGIPNPLSIITIASLADLGYAVNMTAADPYSLFDPQGVAPQESPESRLFIGELPPPVPIPIDIGGG